MNEKSTQEKIVMLSGACEKLEADLASATAKAADLRSDYDAKAISRLACGDAKGAKAARQAIAEAQADVEDLQTGLAQTQTYLAAARADLAAEIEAAAWNATQAAGDRYIAAMAELQDTLGVLLDKLFAVQPLVDQMLTAAPVRIGGMDHLTERQRIHDVRLNLAKFGGDRIGKLGATPILDPQYLQRMKTLTESAREHVAGLLGHRGPTPGDAA